MTETSGQLPFSLPGVLLNEILIEIRKIVFVPVRRDVARADGLAVDDQLGSFDFKDGEGVFVVIPPGLGSGFGVSKNAGAEYVQNINEAINIRAGYLQPINDYNQTIIQMNYLLNR